ncbi:glycosyl hydrolase [Actinoplanes bogorensis]|uniref:Glycosyl hydrolase n=1 Tax=Paractinoplanes bogorensis TaxID=1610840 RepID=A0ABS5Z3W7_9ACTN|nr:glycosyl hydrolase [Actinoplanes bogorensis]MBU2669633.1 glycosyl hydrolase [Actinoplanes bogorensis]
MRLAAALLLLVAVGVAGCSADDSPDAGTTATASPSSAGVPPAVAPYIDIVSGTVDISAAAEATGQKSYTLAFILANSSGACTATWGGTTALDDSTVQTEIDKMTSLGGTPVVSSGGATGTYLESVCTADELAKQYAAALDAAGSNHLDVDIEQSITPATVVQALTTLQADRGTSITLTVPVGGTVQGLTDASIALLQAAKTAGLDVTVNAMTMNFSASGDWGTAMTTATEAVKADVAAVWSDLDDTAVYKMLGVTPMIGVNDTGPVTTVANVKTLIAYGEKQGLGFVRFWSVNRDNGGCTDGSVSPTCSGITQTEYQFTKLFAAFKS